MAFPIVAIPIVARFLLTRGVLKAGAKYGMKQVNKAKQYIKTNKLTKQNPTVTKKPTKKITVTKASKPTKKTNIKKVRPTNKKTTKKTETTTQKPDKKFFDKAGIKKPVGGSTALVKYNPRQIAIVKNKPKSLLTKADKALLAAISGTSLIATTGTKKTETKTTKKSNAPGGKSSSTKPNAPGGVTMDDMLNKNVRGVPAGFKTKGSKPKGKGQFGSNISFTSKDVKNLKQNAKDLKKQIDGLDITNFQKLRLKKLIDTRDPGYSMGESYNRAFNEVKRRVKDKKLNFAIDVSGYAG